MVEAVVIIFGCIFFYLICESRQKIIHMGAALAEQKEFNEYVCEYLARQLRDEEDLEGRDQILKDIKRVVNKRNSYF